MAHLDKFIKAMLSKPGATLRFAAGAQPVLVADGRPQPLMAKAASAGQVRSLVAEVMSPEDRRDADGRDGVTFTYTPPGMDPVEIAMSGWRSSPRCEVRAAPEPSSPGDGLEIDLGGPPPGAAGGPATSFPPVLGGGPSPDPAPQVPVAPAPPQVSSSPQVGIAATPSMTPENGPFPPVTEGSPDGSPAIDILFRAMFEYGASDLHMTSKEIPMIRKDGEMRRIPGQPEISPELMQELLEAIMPERNREEFATDNDTDFAYEIEGLSRFRCNVFRDRHGPGAVFRTIPTKILTAEQLGLPEAVTELGKLSKGLVLVTGPTGSGKSTTLAALIDFINRTRGGHIITIEDPIEFVHPNKQCLVNQREVKLHTQSFKRALRAALREDPDIVLVGEMRDLETIAIAIETAETGHLVFGTLHTSTAYSTVDRIIDQFPTDQQEQIRVMLSESLKGVVSQTLCKKIGGGRIAALEIMIGTKAIANLIREGKTFQIPSVMQTNRNLGMQLLNDALIELVKGGKVEPTEAYVKAVEKQSLAQAFKSANIEMN